MKDNRSFFEKLTGSVKTDDESTEDTTNKMPSKNGGDWLDEEPTEEGQLTVDL